MEIEIRLAIATDAQKIAQFQLQMAQETESKSLDLALVERAVGKVFTDTSKGFYVVAAADSIPIGSLMITYEWSDWRDTNMWYIQSVYLEKPFRGKSVFSRMFGYVRELAEKENVKVIRLYVEKDNSRAQNVYEALGMKKMPYYMYDLVVAD